MNSISLAFMWIGKSLRGVDKSDASSVPYGTPPFSPFSVVLLRSYFVHSWSQLAKPDPLLFSRAEFRKSSALAASISLFLPVVGPLNVTENSSALLNSGVLLLDPFTASVSAATFPGSLAWPFTHSNLVFALVISRSLILAMIGSIRSLFSTSLPVELFQLFFSHFGNHSVRHWIE